MHSAPKGNWIKNIFIGKARDISDQHIFHKLSLIAVLAWVGLGSDGLSSSCYGPEESIKALGAHIALAPFIALACVITIVIICASYSQIIELFPGGGGGYLVASKLLSPSAGVVSGCALLVDYVLTISLSISSGADQLFSILDPKWQPWKPDVALAATAVLTLLNLRGVKEAVAVWAPIFFVFLATHTFAVLYGVCTHMGNLTQIASSTMHDLGVAHAEQSKWGWLGVGLLLLKSYSLGAGSYTGIEAVSNGLPILREPRVATGKRTMIYMGVSLAFMVGGLLVSYLIYHSVPQKDKTLNAILFEQMTASWPHGLSVGFIWIAMFSAAALLFIAAQTGFLDGPRVLANMALDRWFPTRFATLSDRFVARNGILLMGVAAFILIWASGSSVDLLVVLYSINVFITFSLSQLGMVVHWWQDRGNEPKWKRKLAINAVGFTLTAMILIALSAIKFFEGGWVTIVVTGALIGVAFLVHRHYKYTNGQLKRLDELAAIFSTPTPSTRRVVSTRPPAEAPACVTGAQTAAIFVNGYNGLGVHTVLGVNRMFPGVFKNFIFAQVGVVDAGNFKGAVEIDNLEASIKAQASRYSEYMLGHGYYAEAVTAIGTEIVETAVGLADQIAQKYPNTIFFGGQLVFEHETYFTRILHNFAVFVLQREFFKQGKPFFVLPIRV